MERRDPGPRAASGPAAVTPARPYLLEQIDDAAVVQLYADGFGELSLREKTLVWHLYRAAIAGRDIYYDQRHRRAYEGFAEFIRHWCVYDDATVQIAAPKTIKWWNRWLDAHPDEAKRANFIRDMVQAYVNATPSQRAAVLRADEPLKKVQLPMSLSPVVSLATPPIRTRATVKAWFRAMEDRAIVDFAEKSRVLSQMTKDYQRAGGVFNPAEGFLAPWIWMEAIDMGGQRGFRSLDEPLYSPDGKTEMAPALTEVVANSGFKFDTDEYRKFADYYQSVRAMRLYHESGRKYQMPGGPVQAQRNIDVVVNDPKLKDKAERSEEHTSELQSH